MSDELPGQVRSLVGGHWGRDPGAATRIRDGGEECDVWATDGPDPLVIRIAPAWRRRDDLAWVHAVVAALARDIPEAVCPIESLSGTTIVMWRDRPVSLWPLIPGTHVDRSDDRAATQAAGLLARLHRAALRLPDTDTRPIPVDRVHLVGDSPDLHDPRLDGLLGAPRADRPQIVVHGDFYRRNLLYRNGSITGLIDWDEMRHDRPITELAWATWEFAKNDAGDRLLDGRAGRFLSAYMAADGPPFDRNLIVPLIRHGLRVEIRRAQALQRAGETVDHDYLAAERSAFTALADHAGI